jgi:ubiquinone/menaquinone biosynthesis C-methylase UbiE
MKTSMDKYFDWQQKRPLSSADGCTLGEWMSSGANASFAVHPKGFKIFLPPGDIDLSDEYKAGDPYEVAMDSPFHARRVACTTRLAQVAIAKCRGGLRLLDIGCGAGHLTAALQKAFPQAEMSALDYSVSAVATGVDLYPEIDFVAGNAYFLPYAEGYFDLAVCNNIWEHVPDPLRMLESIRRVLRPGGFLIISTPSRYRFENLLRLLRGRPVEFNSKLHVTEYSVGQVQEQLRSGKFEVIEHYSQPLKRKQPSLRKRLVYGAVLPMFRTVFRLYGRQHDLESTVFFLARNTSGTVPTSNA